MELNPGSKPSNSKYYPVPIINKENFCIEFKRLVEIVVLTLVQHSQCGTPIFIIPKKEDTVRFIIDYRRLNQKLVIKPYILPIIGKTMQKLEEFQYETEFDLNMGYYNIRLSLAS